MGTPATPTPSDRQAARELAKAIVDAVRNDEGWPDELFRAYSTETIFRFAQEIELMAADVKFTNELYDVEHDRADENADEVTKLEHQLAAMTAARDEACEIADWLAHEYEVQPSDRGRRIAELRKVGES